MEPMSTLEADSDLQMAPVPLVVDMTTALPPTLASVYSAGELPMSKPGMSTAPRSPANTQSPMRLAMDTALPRSSTGIILLAPFTSPHTMQLDERSTSMEITVCPARWFTGSFTKEP